MFEIPLPIASLPEQTPAIVSPDSPVCSADFQGKRFIIIDDDPQVTISLAAWLKTLGGEVIAYDSGEAALADSARIFSGDYYISDYWLPGAVSGLDLLSRIRTQSDAPCVLVTGDASAVSVAGATNNSIAVLLKPVIPAQLLRTLLAQEK